MSRAPRRHSSTDVQLISMENATLKERRLRREKLRLQRRQKESDLRAQRRAEIEQMHYYGHESTLSRADLAELAERVKHRVNWRSTW